MRSWRLSAAHLGRLRFKVLLAGVAGAVVLLLVHLLLGTAGLVLAVAGLQGLTLVALYKVRVDLARASRADSQRVERHLTGLMHGQDQRLQAIERGTDVLLGETTDSLIARVDELAERGDQAEAMRVLEEALEHRPSSVEVRIRLVESLQAEGRIDEARRIAQRLPAASDATFVVQPSAVRFEALRIRRELEVDPPNVSELAEETQRQIDGNHMERARRLAELGYRAHPRSIRLTDRLVSVLDAQGEADRALELAVENSGRRIESLRERRPDGQEQRQLTPQQRILVSGYFYSGSSAVVDHLLGFAGAVKWTPAGEMRLIKFPGGIADLSDRMEAVGALHDHDLLDLYLHLIGRKVVGHGSEIYSHWGMVNRNSRRLQRRPEATGYLACCLEGFRELVAVRDSLTHPDLLERCRAIIERALDAAATDTAAELLVIDQAVTAWKLDISRFVPASTFVVVHRDPRDQYAEVRSVVDAPGRGRQHARTPEGFAARYRRDREQVDRLIPALERSYGHRFVQLSFEDFVADHERVAADLANRLGLDLSPGDDPRFDPSVSIANVGKHVGRVEPAEVEVLRELLPEYLSEHADRPHGSRATTG